jgi:hypothetical protein
MAAFPPQANGRLTPPERFSPGARLPRASCLLWVNSGRLGHTDSMPGVAATADHIALIRLLCPQLLPIWEDLPDAWG